MNIASDVSLVMATYNGIKYIKEQLDSIRDQSLSPGEVIIIDDASSDGTSAYIKIHLR